MTKHLPEEIRRTQILDAARKCFVEKGYFPTRVDDIAKEAKLSKGGIYFHFEGKRQIFEALVKQEYKNSEAFLNEMSAKTGSYEEMFENLARYYLDFFKDRPDYPRFFMVMGEMAGRDESVRNMLAALQREYTKVISRIIQAGIDSGALKPVDPEATAMLLKGIIDAIEGYIAIGVDMELERVLATGMEVIMNGLLKKE
jgi:AcrR family transcriptional regulator